MSSLTSELSIVTDETFEEQVLRHDKPVLVDFWAQWCPPCHMIVPVLKQIAVERADSLIVVKINNDENPLTGRTYHIMSLPTLMLFVDGRPVRALVGARPKAKLLGELDAALRDMR